MSHMKYSVGFALPVFSLLLLVGCDSGGDAGSDGTTTAADSSSTTVPGSSPATSGSLLGSWTADAGAILAANTINVGGVGSLVCEGPIVMTFNADGSFDRSGEVSCTIAGTSAVGTIVSVGNWQDTGTTLIISGSSTSGTMTMGGTVVPLADSFGDGTGDYSIVGDTLTITFTIDPVGTVTQIYTRV